MPLFPRSLESLLIQRFLLPPSPDLLWPCLEKAYINLIQETSYRKIKRGGARANKRLMVKDYVIQFFCFKRDSPPLRSRAYTRKPHLVFKLKAAYSVHPGPCLGSHTMVETCLKKLKEINEVMASKLSFLAVLQTCLPPPCLGQLVKNSCYFLFDYSDT